MLGIMRLASVSLIFVCLCGQSAQAQDIRYTADYKRCIDASNANTFEMIRCITEESARWDVHLNANYKALMARLSPSRQKALIAAQLAWLKFRETNCAFWYDPEGGQAARLAGNSCFLQVTAARAEELRIWLKMQ